MTPRVRTAVMAIGSCVALAGCGEVTESVPLPWLRIKTQGSEHEYYVKRFGFVWVKLDEKATGNVIPLDANTAAISTAQGLKLLSRGSEHGILACGSSQSLAFVVPQAGVVDCFDVVGSPAASAASQIRWRRISGEGEALVVERIRVENANRHFARATASFYDAGHQPYFVTMNADVSAPAECALVWIAGGETRSLAAPADLARGQCSDAASWAGIMKRPLRKA
jgi:hypothetical protein